jgi:hypothetical protein
MRCMSELQSNSLLPPFGEFTGEALIRFVTQSARPLTRGIYAPKVSIPLEGKVPLGDKGPGWEGKGPTASLGPLVQNHPLAL